MKTTNNKLLDNTGNPVSHNRPMVKEILPLQCVIGNIYTTEVERPMNDAEYIEYLEKENQEQKQVYEARISEYIKKADKHYLENKELKDKLSKIVYEKLSEAQRIISALAKQEQYFLKVVESVLYEHTLDFDLMCMKSSCDHATKTYREHLLQEIKNAIEKGKE